MSSHSNWGGTTYPWSSPFSIGLILVSVLSLVMFTLVERKAAEPVLPLRLFRQRTFVITSAVGLIVGFALFGSVTYFPLFLQVVKGASPTASGLQMLPMMAGMLVTSIGSGQLISRTGRYKLFPIAGTAVMASGLFFLSRLSPQSTTTTASLLLLALGLEYSTVELRQGAAHNITVQAVLQLPPDARSTYALAFTASLDSMFFVAAVVCAVGFVLSWVLPERPLRATVAATAGEIGNEAGESFARPADEDAVASRLYATLSALADRDVQRAHIEQIIERAGETLSPLAAWLLVQMEENPDVSPHDLAYSRGITTRSAQAALEELRRRGLVTVPRAGSASHSELTATGCRVLDRLVTARRAHLEELAEEWDPSRQNDAAQYLRDAVRDLVPDVRQVTTVE